MKGSHHYTRFHKNREFSLQMLHFLVSENQYMYALTIQSVGYTLLRIFLQRQGMWPVNHQTSNAYIHITSMHNLSQLFFILYFLANKIFLHVIAAKPSEQNHFAIKTIDGVLYILEPSVLINSCMAITLKCINAWKRRATMSLHFLGVEARNTFAHTHVQFHHDLIHLLLFHETQQAI